MSQSDSSESDSSDAKPISSGEVETPRGGFMARPGLKAPPRHAVVVRGGDAPESDHIPVARPSLPPPPPPSLPPESLGEKITLRAIPTPRPQPAEPVVPPRSVPPVAAVAAALESVPPPSDAPVVANVAEARASVGPLARRSARSSLTILAAALAGLLLGIVSVVTTVRVREAAVASSVEPLGLREPAVAAAARPAQNVALPRAAGASESSPTRAVAQLPSARSATRPKEMAAAPTVSADKSQPPRAPAVKRSIF